MQLNLSTDIALRTLIYLGQKDAPATINEVSEAFDISKTHLMKVVMTLVSSNLLVSERGRNGGIRLALDAKDIAIGEVVRLMENHLALVICMKEDATNDVCPLMPQCRLRSVFFDAQLAFLDSLNRCSLADLLMPSAKKR
ncbi:MAG: Rrf2 family transcriptional regulator [Nitrosomonadales bacterium]|nr:Rrf2 family transcriptional regulator [Nitrosomonadales bacterium]